MFKTSVVLLATALISTSVFADCGNAKTPEQACVKYIHDSAIPGVDHIDETTIKIGASTIQRGTAPASIDCYYSFQKRVQIENQAFDVQMVGHVDMDLKTCAVESAGARSVSAPTL